MNLPVRLVKFYYPNALEVLLRSFHNSLTVVEEDLAVGLMWKLLFTPLFHDSSFIGRILSFSFRLFRLILGLGAFILLILLFAFIGIWWFLSPFIWIILPGVFKTLDLLLVLFGLALFIEKTFNEPAVTIWHVKNPVDALKASKLKPKNLNWKSLIYSFELTQFLETLELTPKHFAAQNIEVTPDVLEKAFLLAKASDAKYLSESYLWVAMLLSLPGVSEALLKLELIPSDFEQALKFYEYRKMHWRRVYIWDEEFSVKHLKGVNRGWLSVPTPFLDGVCEDLTKTAASKGFPLFVGRQEVVSETLNILSADHDRNVLLVGAAGSGKSALVNYLSRLIVSGDAPEVLATKRLVFLDTSKLLSNVETEGDLAGELKQLFAEIEYSSNIIVFLDELHNLGQGQAAKDFNFFGLLAPFLESDKFQFIATTEPENYQQIIEKNNQFARIFHRVEVPPATKEETTIIIQQRAVELMRDQKLRISFVAIKELIEDSVKFIRNRVLPDGALYMLEEVVTAVAKDSKVVSKALVRQVFATVTRIPSVDIDEGKKGFLLNLEQEIAKNLIGQKEAVVAVANTIRRSSTALRDQNRPIGSFLFLGPTGVGKTQLAKTLAKVYYKNSSSFLQFDMSVYQTPESVERLIGNSENLGELTTAVVQNPYSLILLDEFEKADAKVLTVFLQVLEEGRLDAASKQVDFSNSIIIATSNTASLMIAQGISENKDFGKLKQEVKSELLKQFKPELINRFDDIVIFKPLAPGEIEMIVNLKLIELAEKLKTEGYLVEFGPDLVTALAEKGYDQTFGARPLRRLIQDNLEAKLSTMILENQLKKGELLKLNSQFLN